MFLIGPFSSIFSHIFRISRIFTTKRCKDAVRLYFHLVGLIKEKRPWKWFQEVHWNFVVRPKWPDEEHTWQHVQFHTISYNFPIQTFESSLSVGYIDSIWWNFFFLQLSFHWKSKGTHFNAGYALTCTLKSHGKLTLFPMISHSSIIYSYYTLSHIFYYSYAIVGCNV